MLFPPQWTPLNPHFSLASLTSQLRDKGHEVKIRDLNIEFYNEILTKKHLLNCVDQLINTKDDLFNVMLKEYSEEKQVKDYTEDFQKKLVKYEKIKDFLNNRSNDLKNIPDKVEDAVAVMRDKERFYDPVTLIKALNTLDDALEIASLPYAPSSIGLDNFDPYYDPRLKRRNLAEFSQNPNLTFVEADVRGSVRYGMMNIGTRPTFVEGGPVVIELHLFEWNGGITGEELTVRFLRYIRPEKKFSDMNAFTTQLERDRSECLRHLQSVH